MSRVEVRGNGRYSMAFGVDLLPSIGAFVQVWDHSQYDMPDPDNLVEEHDRTTTGGYNLTEEFVIKLARQYDIPVDPQKVWEVFD